MTLFPVPWSLTAPLVTTRQFFVPGPSQTATPPFAGSYRMSFPTAAQVTPWWNVAVISIPSKDQTVMNSP